MNNYHDGRAWRPNEFELNALLAIVHGSKPRDELQACLVAQMAATHVLTMRASSYALNEGDGGPPRVELAALTARLSRAFCDQTNTLRKLKSKGGRQHITVKYERHEHKHVHVHHEGEGRKSTPKPKDAQHAEGAPVPKLSKLDALRLANLAPRCLARTRRGTECQRPAKKGRPRCVLHGCAKGSGAPTGAANGSWKGGAWTNEAKALRRDVSRTLAAWRKTRDA